MWSCEIVEDEERYNDRDYPCRYAAREDDNLRNVDDYGENAHYQANGPSPALTSKEPYPSGEVEYSNDQ